VCAHAGRDVLVYDIFLDKIGIFSPYSQLRSASDIDAKAGFLKERLEGLSQSEGTRAAILVEVPLTIDWKSGLRSCAELVLGC
jgi:hypothetical protein